MSFLEVLIMYSSSACDTLKHFIDKRFVVLISQSFIFPYFISMQNILCKLKIAIFNYWAHIILEFHVNKLCFSPSFR